MLNKLLKIMLVCSLSMANVYAGTENKANIEELRKFVQNFSSFRANFVQTQPDESTFSANQSRGYMAIEKPGRLFWVYQQPEHQEIVTDATNLWIYEEELDQATVRPLASVQADFPMRWLLFDESVEQNFEVIAGQKTHGISWFNLVPKNNTFFQSIDVAIKGNELLQIWMYQDADNVTKVFFRDIEVNPKLAESQFTFVPPRGVDVIGEPVK
jgi:outer membrane lipoprotein carrier protein